MMLLAHTLAAAFMTGVIWYVQLVQYPLFALAGGPEFSAYHRKHCDRTTWIVLPVMTFELVTAVALAFHPVGLTFQETLLGLGLLVAVWLSTFALQVPQHRQLESGFDHAVVDALVQGNWIRTSLWTARTALCAVGLSRLV